MQKLPEAGLGLIGIDLPGHGRDESYAETLRIYLQNNESIAATAKELALHRSSLIDRLERIRQLLGLDLSDPDVRLLLQVILRSETLFGDEAYSR